MAWLRKYKWLQTAVSIGLLLVLWQVLSATGIFGLIEPGLVSLFFPGPLAVLAAAREGFAQGQLFTDIGISALRAIGGFAIASLLGIPLGLVAANSRLLSGLLQPLINIFQPIPGIAWAPLAIIWFGLNNKAAVFIIALSSFFPIVVSAMQGARSLDRSVIDAAQTLGAKRSHIFYKVVLPGSVPSLVAGCRIGMGFAWRTLIAAELIGMPRGLGYLLGTGRGLGRTDVVMLTMALLGIIMVLMDQALLAPIEAYTARWRRSAVQ